MTTRLKEIKQRLESRCFSVDVTIKDLSFLLKIADAAIRTRQQQVSIAREMWTGEPLSEANLPFGKRLCQCELNDLLNELTASRPMVYDSPEALPEFLKPVHEKVVADLKKEFANE